MDHLAVDLERALDAAPASLGTRADAPPALLERPTLPRLVSLALLDWAVIAACWALMALLPAWAWPLPMLVIASRIHAFGVILHDAAHMALPGKPPLARLLELLCGYPLATTLDAMRYHHLRHHRDSGMATDPYFKDGVDQSWLLYAVNIARGLLLLPFWTVRPYVGIAAYWLPALRPTYAKVFLQDRSHRADTGLPRDLRASREVAVCAREEHGQALFQLGVLGLALYAPLAVIVGYVLPSILAGVLAAYRLLLEHRYRPTHDRALPTLFATTTDHHIGSPLKWLFAPRNIGYHVVHHAHPNVALWALPALREWYAARYPDYPAAR